MRDIKFRVWDEENKRMLEVTQITWSVQNKGKMEVYSVGRINNPILMQYTGLKDKNGKEIYEGDLLKTRERDGVHRHLVYEVVWVGAGFQLKPNDNTYENQVVTSGVDLGIIGNIYENPELLLTKEQLEAPNW